MYMYFVINYYIINVFLSFVTPASEIEVKLRFV